MFDTPLFKTVGAHYEVTCDRKNHIVVISCDGRKKESFKFKKFGDAITFYASLKRVKDMKDTDKLAGKFERAE